MLKHIVIASLLTLGACAPQSADKAQPVRLIGLCGGQYHAAMYEDQFPANCDWIEPIRVEGEADA